MGYWGWRPLVCGVFFSVWIAGCTVVAETTNGTTPTAFPSVTLTVGRIVPFSTASPTQVAAVGADTTLSAPEPSCYANRSGGILCLGVIENRGSSALALDNAFVTVRLMVRGQTVERRARFEQRQVNPGGIAPYRAAFSAPPDSGYAPQIEISLPVIDSAPLAWVRLTPINAAAAWDGGRYQVSASLRNDDSQDGVIQRVVITLRDEIGRVIGYRVIAPDAIRLAPGESFPLRVEIVPLSDITVRTPPPRIDIYAEGSVG
jgi:hypothetical protein